MSAIMQIGGCQVNDQGEVERESWPQGSGVNYVFQTTPGRRAGTFWVFLGSVSQNPWPASDYSEGLPEPEREEWLLSLRHLASEEAADADTASGQVEVFDTVDDLIQDLRS